MIWVSAPVQRRKIIVMPWFVNTEQTLKRKKGEREPYELAWTRKDGSPLYTLISPKPLFSEAGRFQGSFAVITDITERKKTEESLRNALSEIKALKDRLETENIYFREK